MDRFFPRYCIRANDAARDFGVFADFGGTEGGRCPFFFLRMKEFPALIRLIKGKTRKQKHGKM